MSKEPKREENNEEDYEEDQEEYPPTASLEGDIGPN
jgi:hypothetical protein